MKTKSYEELVAEKEEFELTVRLHQIGCRKQRGGRGSTRDCERCLPRRPFMITARHGLRLRLSFPKCEDGFGVAFIEVVGHANALGPRVSIAARNPHDPGPCRRIASIPERNARRDPHIIWASSPRAA